MSKTILHLCADIGSDSFPYQVDTDYNVVMIGRETGVENYYPEGEVHGIISNPPCTDYSTAPGFHKKREASNYILNHCLRIIRESKPVWWLIENPTNGTMVDVLGTPTYTYQPWWYGSPWTKKTSLWGNFEIPKRIYYNWNDVPKLNLYVRPGRSKPSLACLHKSSINLIPEFIQFKDSVYTDADFRSLCSQGFAQNFKEANP